MRIEKWAMPSQQISAVTRYITESLEIIYKNNLFTYFTSFKTSHQWINHTFIHHFHIHKFLSWIWEYKVHYTVLIFGLKG